jgi:hypothetical protein
MAWRGPPLALDPTNPTSTEAIFPAPAHPDLVMGFDDLLVPD